MGEPAIPTPAERLATRELAARVLDAVRADSSIAESLGFSRHIASYERESIEPLIFDLANEIEMIKAALGEALRKTGPYSSMDDDRYAELCVVAGIEP